MSERPTCAAAAIVAPEEHRRLRGSSLTLNGFPDEEAVKGQRHAKHPSVNAKLMKRLVLSLLVIVFLAPSVATALPIDITLAKAYDDSDFKAHVKLGSACLYAYKANEYGAAIVACSKLASSEDDQLRQLDSELASLNPRANHEQYFYDLNFRASTLVEAAFDYYHVAVCYTILKDFHNARLTASKADLLLRRVNVHDLNVLHFTNSDDKNLYIARRQEVDKLQWLLGRL